MTDLETTATAFIKTAHRIVWATVATVDVDNNPRTRILHPIWEWTGDGLVGWIATSPQSPKAEHLEHHSQVSLTYWDATHDVATADCATEWLTSSEDRHATWQRFLNAPEPVGYDPSIIPAWTSADVEAFGVLKLRPHRLRVLEGSLMLTGQGELFTWRA